MDHRNHFVGESLIHLDALQCDDEEMAFQTDGNPLAFAELYRRHVSHVYRYLFVRVGNVPDAEDLTSQTFLAAFESISGYRGEGKYAAWLLGIARRKAADHFRHWQTVLPLEWGTRMADPNPSLEESVVERSRREQLINAIRGLTPDRAEALSLRVFGGLSAADVGYVMGKSEGAVKMLVSRALQDLRRRLIHEGRER